MDARFEVAAKGNVSRHDPARAQIVFHGINKSGSLAMANVMRDAYAHAGRQAEFLSHYHSRGVTEEAFIRQVEASPVVPSFVVSHYLFGALSPLPGRAWITQFRHPLPRVVSCYQWIKTKFEAQGGTFESLERFVLRSRKGVGHSQVAQFGTGFGPFGRDRRKRMSSHDMFEISVDQMAANISLIGIAEHFEESIFAFAAFCGLGSVAPWKRDTRNKGRRLVTELTDSEIALIQDQYQYDFKLYEHALALFRAQNERLGIEGASLQRYRDACRSQYNDRIV